jgi:hypothetical protein
LNPASKEKSVNRKWWSISIGLCVLAISGVWVAPSVAQMMATKQKPPMYSYVANWQIPRAHWGEMQKSMADDAATFDKGIADGTIVAYGNDENRVHTAEGETHDDWWSSMSEAGVFNMLDRLYKAGAADSPALESATKHWDEVYVSRFYNWHPGTYKDAYTTVAVYNLKKDAPDDALDNLSKHLIGPLLEKLLADGTIVEWEVDTQAVHTAPETEFLIVYLSPNAEAMDKVEAAVRETIAANPLSGSAFDAVVDSAGHSDEVLRSNVTYK